MNVFISYSSKDEIVARNILNFLEQRGCRCWLASRDCKSDYMAEIIPAIRYANVVILLASEASARSRHVRIEAGRAVKYEKEIIPILLGTNGVDSFDGSWLEYVLESFQAIIGQADDATERLLSRLGIHGGAMGNEHVETVQSGETAGEDNTIGLGDVIKGAAIIGGLAGLANYLLEDGD